MSVQDDGHRYGFGLVHAMRHGHACMRTEGRELERGKRNQKHIENAPTIPTRYRDKKPITSSTKGGNIFATAIKKKSQLKYYGVQS